MREKLGEQRKGGTGGPPPPPPASLHALAARLPRLPPGFVPGCCFFFFFLFPPACGDRSEEWRPRRGRPCGGDRSTAETHGAPLALSPPPRSPARLSRGPSGLRPLAVRLSPLPRPSPAALRVSPCRLRRGVPLLFPRVPHPVLLLHLLRLGVPWRTGASLFDTFLSRVPPPLRRGGSCAPTRVCELGGGSLWRVGSDGGWDNFGVRRRTRCDPFPPLTPPPSSSSSFSLPPPTPQSPLDLGALAADATRLRGREGEGAAEVAGRVGGGEGEEATVARAHPRAVRGGWRDGGGGWLAAFCACVS